MCFDGFLDVLEASGRRNDSHVEVLVPKHDTFLAVQLHVENLLLSCPETKIISSSVRSIRACSKESKLLAMNLLLNSVPSRDAPKLIGKVSRGYNESN